MAYVLPQDHMPEAEVALRLAFHLLALPNSEDTDGNGVFDGDEDR